MAITQTGSVLEFNTGATTNTGTASSAITVPSDATFVVVGLTCFSSSANYFTSGTVTFTKGGADTAMTVASTLGTDTSNWSSAMWYMALPDTGSNKSLKWDWSGAGAGERAVYLSVTFWTGVDTTSSPRSTSGGNAANTPYTTGTLTCVTNDLIVAFVGAFSNAEGTAASWSNLTTLAQLTRGGDSQDGAWATGSPSGNTTVACSTDTNWDDGGIVAIVLIPSSAGGQPLTGLLAKSLTGRLG